MRTVTMSTVAVNPMIQAGQACVIGTRVPVTAVALTMWHHGLDEVRACWPQVDRIDALTAAWFVCAYRPVGRRSTKAEVAMLAAWRPWADRWLTQMQMGRWDLVPDPPRPGEATRSEDR